MKNVVAYIRVSTDGQCGEDKYGLDAQTKDIESIVRNMVTTFLNGLLMRVNQEQKKDPVSTRLFMVM